MAFRTKFKHSGGVKDPSTFSHSGFHVGTVSSPSSNGLFNYSVNTVSQSSPPSVLAGTGYSSLKRRVPLCKVDHGSVTDWLAAMKDSSPPRTRSSRVDADDMEYNNWMESYPSALKNFEKVLEAAHGKRIFVFLDYDGTLSPIVENPESAFMSEEMRAAVKEIASLFPTAIITGRSREKVYEFVQLPELYYAGSHGMDIMGPAEGCGGHKIQGTRVLNDEGNEIVMFQPASEYTAVMDEIFKLLEEKASKVNGAKVEHNKFCVSVHFRRVNEEDWLHLAEHVQQVLRSYPNLCLTQGRKVLEVRPLILWNKGKALDYLLKAFGFGNRSDVFPIYIGDDLTDEDAFKSVARRKHGLAILVSNVVKDTNATCSLRDPSEVLEFLRSLVKWKRRCLSRHLFVGSQNILHKRAGVGLNQPLT
ncbi:hypothetical protein KP509_28G028300 [Ceratopteris richardii]|uniref:Trehalose 6-phosphate phosphatase n=3 Tax=Ceratopteris richardii TaxID=49495 RepID=A0A8T2RD93_CERRI|nr:hypothetical protein KP509_28G028300 [Ceratopteris richardii]KAH7293495.1 hypothetical protein KP509_28G028300 [Ceratopteris richardii]KAH7293499.1 hypothetical protein KP509_28G028300 [Ceratopteris richardii]